MKIMYICGMYLPSYGGAEMSMYSLLKQLKEKLCWEVIVVTDFRYEKTKKNNLFNKLKIQTVQHDTRVEEIEDHILKFKPDVILTQLMWSDVALKLAKKHNIPSIMRVCKVPLELDLSKKSDYSPTAIIATSKHVRNYIKKRWERKSYIISPLVEKKEYIISDKKFDPIDNLYIFMFNPLLRKGGVIFKKIAKQLSNKRFGTVLGWCSLKEDCYSNNFSKKYINRVTESEGSVFDGSLPTYINFEDCPNIKILNPEDDVKIIYKKIRLLLVPSQWEEAFGRVAIEAMINGIPVIGSNVGGLKETIGKGGVLLNKRHVNEWVREILKFDDIRYYAMMSEKGKKWIEDNYSEKCILKDFVNLINHTH